MKRLLAILLCACLMLAGCSAPSTSSQTQLASTTAYSDSTEYTGIDDPALVENLEIDVYNELVNEIDSSDYLVEEVQAVYVSQEYLDEITFNSQENIFFGYSLEQIIDYFGDTPYVFTVEDGQTVVKEFTSYEDTWEEVAKNVAMGSGVIIVCATVSVVAPAVGAPAAITAVFTFATQGALTGAAITAPISGIMSGIMTNGATGDIDKTIKAAALGASEGFKSGAIIGAVAGGAAEGLGLYNASRNGLTMSQAAEIQLESKYPLDTIKTMRNMKEYEVYKDAKLTPTKITTSMGTRNLLLRDIDLKQIDADGLTNLERMQKGLAPVDADGISFELHHVSQKNDGTLALLTRAEHDSSGLHIKQLSEIDKGAFNSERGLIYKQLANMFG